MNQNGLAPRIYFSLVFYLTFFGFGGFFSLLTVYFREEAELSGAQIGTIMSIGPVVMVLAQPVWGMICDVTRRSRAVLVLTVFATGTWGLGYLFATDYVWMLVIAVALAAFQAGIVPISDSLAMGYVHRRGGDYGNLRLWGAIGFASAAYLMGEASESVGLWVIFYVFALVMWLCAIISLKLPQEKVSFEVDFRSSLYRLIKIPQFPLFLIVTFLVYGPVQANNFYFGLLIKDLGGSLAGVGLGFLFAAGSEAPFMKIAGAWIRRQGLLSVIMMATVVGGLRWIFYFFEPSVFWVYVTTFTQGLSVGLFIPAALQYVQKIAPREVATTAIALYSAVGTGLGSWFFTLLGGLLLDWFDVFATYLFYGMMTLAGGLIVLWIMRMETRGRITSAISR